MSKELCKSKKARLKEKAASQEPDYIAKHICRKCQRTAAKKKSLCKPIKLELATA